jgi:L-alanine-DL-glutamate epimerase-like enolase superfamily enzyme
MKIVAIRSYLKHMALTKPYTIAYNTFTDVSIAFLEIELENGMVGYGTGSPAEDVVGETTQETVQNLQSDFIQQLVGRDIQSFQQIIFETNNYFNHKPGTLAAVDLALHDAFCKFINCSVAQYYGQKIKALPTSVTIGIKNVQDTLLEAAGYKDLGFKILKVKTGLDVDEDIERVLKLKEKFGNHFKTRVDANQGYSLQDLKKFIDATRNADLELIEQPMKVGVEAELISLSWADRALLAADESLKDPQAALQLASSDKPFGIYNIKLMKCGGLMGAHGIATIAQNASIDLFWGCNDESILSITAALHFAYSCPNTKYIDLDGSFDLAEDIVKDGFTLIDGEMHINNNPGFGCTLS